MPTVAKLARMRGPLGTFSPYLGDRRQGKLERQLWGPAVELQLLLLRRALVCVGGPAVLCHEGIHGCGGVCVAEVSEGSERA
jgi:hypothetical protein